MYDFDSFDLQAYKRATYAPSYSTSRAPDTYTHIYIYSICVTHIHIYTYIVYVY